MAIIDPIEKPTLGGIRKLQEYLNTTPFPMPVFRYDIYHAKKVDIFHDVPGEGMELNINELIKKKAL
ncbi:hypothetical protein HZA33_00555 [Candidatus Pacearchaeota archaeon]|nr:hypothetical protein [Candidatus Pacearchaeota archaeon]